MVKSSPATDITEQLHRLLDERRQLAARLAEVSAKILGLTHQLVGSLDSAQHTAAVEVDAPRSDALHPADDSAVAPGTRGFAILTALASFGGRASIGRLAREIDLGDPDVSERDAKRRIGSSLQYLKTDPREYVATVSGKRGWWELTPQGERAVAVLSPPPTDDATDPPPEAPSRPPADDWLQDLIGRAQGGG